MVSPTQSVSANRGNRGGSTPHANPDHPDLKRILSLPIEASVILAERPMPIESILEITVGTIIEFNVPFDAELTLSVSDHKIGKGRPVKVGENFGLRVTAMNPIQERIQAMGDRG